uniref:Acidic endoprotease n=1 Tax=Myxococcus xanthus TaxID=34 RepID=Q50902_MYXXA|nr:acidic endoprotease [Myxococcus xanthus]
MSQLWPVPSTWLQRSALPASAVVCGASPAALLFLRLIALPVRGRLSLPISACYRYVHGWCSPSSSSSQPARQGCGIGAGYLVRTDESAQYEPAPRERDDVLQFDLTDEEPNVDLGPLGTTRGGGGGRRLRLHGPNRRPRSSRPRSDTTRPPRPAAAPWLTSSAGARAWCGDLVISVADVDSSPGPRAAVDLGGDG